MDTIADSKTEIQALRDKAMFMLMTACGLRCIEVSAPMSMTCARWEMKPLSMSMAR